MPILWNPRRSCQNPNRNVSASTAGASVELAAGVRPPEVFSYPKKFVPSLLARPSLVELKTTYAQFFRVLI